MRAGRRGVASAAALVLVAALASAALVGPEGAAPGAAAKLDFGDAPDGEPTGYPNRQLGKFPTKLRSNGARATVGGFHLGPQVDAENDAHRPAREFHNDGVVLGSGISCGAAELAVLVTLDEPAPAGGKTVYFNFWADFDHSGSWAGGDRCAKEHAVADASLTVRAGERMTIFEVEFEFGSYSTPIWTRSILSGAPLGREAPTGEVGPGEVEDLPMPFYVPTGQVSCGTGLLRHGGSGRAPISIAKSLYPLRFTEVTSIRPGKWTAKLPAPDGRTAGPGLPRQPNPLLPRRGRIELRSLPGHVDLPRRFEIVRVHGRVVPLRGFQRIFKCRFIVGHGIQIRKPDALRPGGATVTVSLSGGWRHGLFADPKGEHPSRLCVRLRTAPPVAGPVRIVVRDQSGALVDESTVMLGADGTARKDVGIAELGRYSVSASVEVKGKKGSATATVDVTDAQGSCP